MTRLTTRLALAAVLALGACSTTEPDSTQAAASGEARNCFWTREVSSYNAVDDSTVNIRVGVNNYYQLQLLGPCHDIDWSNAIALESRGTSYICSGLDATVISPSPIGPRRCPVQSIRKLTPAEVAAMPKKQKP